MTARRLLTLLVVLLALTRGLVAQDQDEEFKRGLDARDDEKWQDVVTRMRAAIKSDPKESDRKVRRGLSRTDYLPYFFLGEAYRKLNDCPNALDAWAASEKQGAVRGDRLGVITKGRAECLKSGVLTAEDFRRSYDAANRAYQDARRRYLSVEEQVRMLGRQPQHRDQLRQASDELATGYKHLQASTTSRKSADLDAAMASARKADALTTPIEGVVARESQQKRVTEGRASELEQQLVDIRALGQKVPQAGLTSAQQTARKQALGQLAEAEKGMQAWKQDQANTALLDAVARAADTASGSFRSLLDEAQRGAVTMQERQRQQLAEAGLAALTTLDQTLTAFSDRAAQQPSLVKPEMTAAHADLKAKADVVRRQFERARTSGNAAAMSNTPLHVDPLRVAAEALLGRLAPRSLRDRGLPEALENGAALYMRGDYQQSVAALSAELPATGPLRLQAHLFRAAAKYALFVRSGEKEQALLAEARADIQRCHEIDPGFRPDARVFSPRFVALYEGRLGNPATPPRP